MAAAFDLISAQYGWTDAQILDCTLRRIRQIVAAISRRQWLDDLAHRQLETAKLRNICAYIAATLQLAEGADNVMLTAAAHLSLGPGTENPGTDDTAGVPATVPAGTGRGPGRGPRRPVAVVDPATLPDAPTAIRPGQAAPPAPGLRELPADKIAGLFGGAL